MKFYSKFSNHRIVLKPGIPGEPLLGRSPQPGIYVKFEDGVADVKDQDVMERLMAHKDFGNIFVADKNSDEDPFKANRRDLEPEHNVTEIQFGHIGKNLNPQPKVVMNREQRAMVMEVAKEMARQMAPELAKEMLLEMAAERKNSVNEPELAEEKTEKDPTTKTKKK